MKTQSSYVIQITTDDGQGVEHLKTELLKSPSLKDVNDAPTAITLSNNTINENMHPSETLVGTLTTMDEDDPLGNETSSLPTLSGVDTHKDTLFDIAE